MSQEALFNINDYFQENYLSTALKFKCLNVASFTSKILLPTNFRSLHINNIIVECRVSFIFLAQAHVSKKDSGSRPWH